MFYQEAKPEITFLWLREMLDLWCSNAVYVRQHSSLGNLESVWDLWNSKHMLILKSKNSASEYVPKTWSEKDICACVSMLRQMFTVVKT